jgi:hypothetical protein
MPVALPASSALSPLPPEAFADDGVVDVEGLPAHLFEVDLPHQVRGRAPARAATEVYLLLLPPEGGSARFAFRFQVQGNRRFMGLLDLGEVPAGRYGFAMVAGSGGPVSVPRSILATVIH